MVSRLHDLIPAEKQLSWQSFLKERKRDMLPHAMFSEQEVEWKEPPKNLPSPENSDNPWQPTTFPHSPD
jgi:hypothetical protein